MKKHVTRLIATLALGTLAATGYTLTDTQAATPQDTGWGAPDTSGTPVAGTDAGTTIDATPGDTAWG